MSNLYQLTNEFQQLAAMDADDDAAFAEALAETLQATGSQLEDKIEATVMVARQLDADAAACKDEARRLSERAARLERNAKACRERVQWAMQATGRDRVKRPLFTLSIQRNPPSVAISDETAVPDEFKREVTTIKVDRAALKTALKERAIPGAELVASTRLAIR
ncbi:MULTISPECIES: siphovirus Gp157 family protein [Halomonadaceae]|uniref:Siphovirus Gp157 family protein n=1 Tax=Vreelandella gomseomensis TaxID=370766 RepID=A0ABU1GCB3_9GAMM|nr:MULTISPECIES: siphovirus Gp157 family protein [Halomonas]KPQ19662.1 MAG: hypothetical protein HLUCCO06_01325 [Halomonas sp. HL-93]MDR5875111.1 siphovirus Gp157 family protein [Halomonas gomseomensis]SBR51995.1 virus Gp157 [Halomonas sp. HL-93]